MIYGNKFIPVTESASSEEFVIEAMDTTNIVYEEYCNYKNLLEACTDEDERTVLEAKVEVLYEISFKDIQKAVKGVIDKIIKFFKDLFDKIRRFFTGKKDKMGGLSEKDIDKRYADIEKKLKEKGIDANTEKISVPIYSITIVIDGKAVNDCYSDEDAFASEIIDFELDINTNEIKNAIKSIADSTEEIDVVDIMDRLPQIAYSATASESSVEIKGDKINKEMTLSEMKDYENFLCKTVKNFDICEKNINKDIKEFEKALDCSNITFKNEANKRIVMELCNKGLKAMTAMGKCITSYSTILADCKTAVFDASEKLLK